jgi:hypothetical protein
VEHLGISARISYEPSLSLDETGMCLIQHSVAEQERIAPGFDSIKRKPGRTRKILRGEAGRPASPARSANPRLS